MVKIFFGETRIVILFLKFEILDKYREEVGICFYYGRTQYIKYFLPAMGKVRLLRGTLHYLVYTRLRALNSNQSQLRAMLAHAIVIAIDDYVAHFQKVLLQFNHVDRTSEFLRSFLLVA